MTALFYRIVGNHILQGLAVHFVLTFAALWVIGQVRNGKVEPVRFPVGWHLKAIGWFAGCFTPIWVALLFGNLFLLWRVGETISEQLSANPELLRWYVLAFVGLMTTLGGILGTPLAVIRVFTTERQRRTAEQSHITDQINTAVEGLGAIRIVQEAEVSERTSRSGEQHQGRAPMLAPLSAQHFHRPEDSATIFRTEKQRTEPNIEVRVFWDHFGLNEFPYLDG